MCSCSLTPPSVAVRRSAGIARDDTSGRTERAIQREFTVRTARSAASDLGGESGACSSFQSLLAHRCAASRSAREHDAGQ